MIDLNEYLKMWANYWRRSRDLEEKATIREMGVIESESESEARLGHVHTPQSGGRKALTIHL